MNRRRLISEIRTPLAHSRAAHFPQAPLSTSRRNLADTSRFIFLLDARKGNEGIHEKIVERADRPSI